MEQLTPRELAHDRGELRYFSGKPCRRGHLTARWTSTGNCIECQTRHVVRANRVRNIHTVRMPLPVQFAADDVVAMDIYLHEAAKLFVESRGLKMPLHPDAIKWAKDQKRLVSECPYK